MTTNTTSKIRKKPFLRKKPRREDRKTFSLRLKVKCEWARYTCAKRFGARLRGRYARG